MNENDIGKIVVDCAVRMHMKLGYLLNFGEAQMKSGIFRILNGTIE